MTGNPIYAIGDIHGQKSELDRVLGLIGADGGPDAEVVFLGDYTDRGPDSRSVIDGLIEGRDQGRNWHFIRGNHDRMFEWFLLKYPRHDAHLPIELNWLNKRLGGDTTLTSYGVQFTENDRLLSVHAQAQELVPSAHVDFLTSLKLKHETKTLFFCHAGIRPGVPLAKQTEHDLLWIRREFHDDTRMHPKLIVHGHTPIRHATHYGNRINLDTGAGYDLPLTVAVFEGRNCWLLTDAGRVPLVF